MRKIMLLGVVFTMFVSCSSAQKTTKKQADASNYITTIKAEELSKHLYIVAGDEMQGRNTGEPGQ
jgi:uncharacterized protein YcfL